jgi:hypothetical protein
MGQNIHRGKVSIWKLMMPMKTWFPNNVILFQETFEYVNDINIYYYM